MSTLTNLKKWLTLDDSADFLSNELTEKVNPADILQLGLEGEISLSS